MTAYGSVLTAGYRADGLRAWKTTSAGTIFYLYDGDKPVEKLDGSGTKTAVMTFGLNRVLARTTASRTLLYTQDALGQMAQQIDASTGNIIASYLFDAWGARQVSTSDPTAGSDPYSGYNTSAGYITDWETGLQLLGHRYYDPSTGRFLNRDPIGMVGGVNLYGYCTNSPLMSSDSSGNFSGIGIAIISCLYSLLKAMATVPANNNAGWYLLCQLAANCLIPLPSLIAPPLLVGCIIGAICGFLSNIASNACNYIGGCGQSPDWNTDLPCYFLELATATILGALGGCASWVAGGAYLSMLANTLVFPMCQTIHAWW